MKEATGELAGSLIVGVVFLEEFLLIKTVFSL